MTKLYDFSFGTPLGKNDSEALFQATLTTLALLLCATILPLKLLSKIARDGLTKLARLEGMI